MVAVLIVNRTLARQINEVDNKKNMDNWQPYFCEIRQKQLISVWIVPIHIMCIMIHIMSDN